MFPKKYIIEDLSYFILSKTPEKYWQKRIKKHKLDIKIEFLVEKPKLGILETYINSIKINADMFKCFILTTSTGFKYYGYGVVFNGYVVSFGVLSQGSLWYEIFKVTDFKIKWIINDKK